MTVIQDDIALRDLYDEFRSKFVAFTNAEWGIRDHVMKINPTFYQFIQSQGQEIIDIINNIGKLKALDQQALFYNMKIAISLVDGLIYYINFKKDGDRAVTGDDIIEVVAEIAQLMAGITSCLNNMKVDCFFVGLGFLGKETSEYKEFLGYMDKTAQFGKDIENRSKESAELLTKMKLVEKAILREGLAKSFKESVSDLSKKIRFFDKVNYGSLVAMFLVTFLLIVCTDNFDTAAVYGRFLLVTPLLFLSWFASKRSQFLYQIKEEYSYKYATALAYEGYRDEVGDNPDMKNKLMDVTIDNLGRSPLEQFDKNSDHAPYAQFIREFRKKD